MKVRQLKKCYYKCFTKWLGMTGDCKPFFFMPRWFDEAKRNNEVSHATRR